MLRILKPGILSTIQDLGRLSTRAYGVPVGGAMDTLAHRLANVVLGNPAHAASIEIAGGHFAAAVEKNCTIVHVGAGGTLWVDQTLVPYGKALTLPAGTLVEVRPSAYGHYSYLAVAGGWSAMEVLKSRATCLVAGFGGHQGRALQVGDVLMGQLNGMPPSAKAFLGAEFLPRQKYGISLRQFPELCPFCGCHQLDTPESRDKQKNTPLMIRVLSGPEWHYWRPAQHDLFCQTVFVVTAQRNRMGIRLQMADRSVADQLFQGDAYPAAAASMLSTGVCIGAIQIPPNGTPIVLGADAQTIGGYPRLAQIAAVDLPKLVQAPVGQKVSFRTITLEVAENLLFQETVKLKRLSAGYRFRQLSSHDTKFLQNLPQNSTY